MSIFSSPSMVSDGLVLCLDAANKDSYSGTGTAWNDLSGNGNNATLINGPTYSNGNNGNIVFDGANDRVDCGTYFPTIITGTNPFTIECWVYPNSTQNAYADIWGNHGNGYTGVVMQNNGGTGNTFAWGYGTGSSWANAVYFNLIPLKWNHLVAIKSNGSVNKFTYLNSIQVESILSSTNISPNSALNFHIGIGYNLGSSRYFNGRISEFKIYNRALSEKEVLQNYNATRARYGL